MKAILDKCSHLFKNYGGHKVAAGATLKDGMEKTAAKDFDMACCEYYKESSQTSVPVIPYDGTLKIEAVNEKIASHLLDKLYPYCKTHNPEPIFRLKDVELCQVEIKEGDGWRLLILYVLSDGKKLAYPFKMFSHLYGTEISGLKADVYFKFPQKWSQFGYTKFQLQIEYIELKNA